MWEELKKKIVNRADWIFCILLVGFILSFLFEGEGARNLRSLYLVCLTAIGIYLLFKWVINKAGWKRFAIYSFSIIGLSGAVVGGTYLYRKINYVIVNIAGFGDARFPRSMPFLEMLNAIDSNIVPQAIENIRRNFPKYDDMNDKELTASILIKLIKGRFPNFATRIKAAKEEGLSHEEILTSIRKEAQESGMSIGEIVGTSMNKPREKYK